MALQAIEPEEVRVGRKGGKTKGEKYGKYAQAVAKLVPTIEEAIGKSPDGTVRFKTMDVAKEMGADFAKKNATSIYWGLKFVLFHNGIVVDTGTHKSGDKLLAMRIATKDDKLPPSLSKYIEPDEEDMPEPGSESE